MSATPGQKKLVELLLETRELFEDVSIVVENLVQDEEMTEEEAYDLIRALMRAPQAEGLDYRVGGVLRG